MKQFNLHMLIYILAGSLLFSCGSDKGKEAGLAGDSVNKNAPRIPYDTVLTSMAEIIAGIQPLDSTGENAIVQTPIWKAHQKAIDTLFANAERKNLNAMRDWAKKELPEGNDTSATLLYAFSGPDYLYAHTFFPGVSRYVLFGLEPVGKIPVLDTTKDNRLFFDNIRRSLKSSLALNFFITKDMCGDLRSSEYNGVTSIIMLYAAYTHHKIKSINYILAGRDGKIRDCPYDSLRRYQETSGVRFMLIDSAGKQKELLYFSFNAEDDPFLQSSVHTFLSSLKGKIYGMLKAASYLMHYDGFKVMRELFISKISTLLTDDTGLTWKCFSKSFSKHQLYGNYSDPIESFKYINLRDLRIAYDSLKAKPIQFKYGYGYGGKVMVGRK